METNLWQDKEKRRAFLLSLLLHSLFFFLLLLLWRLPEVEALETYLVIDVGTPAFSEEVTLAPAADAPAPLASEPLVESTQAGVPQVAAPAPAEAAPLPRPVVETPVSTAQPTPPTPEAVVQQPPEAQPPVVSQPEPAPPVAQPAVVPPVVEAPIAPQPEVAAQPEASSLPVDATVTEAETTATPLPEVDIPEALEPTQAITLPTPEPEVQVAETQTVAVEPTVQIAPERSLPAPEVTAEVTEAQPVPQPQVTTELAEAAPVPQPDVQTEISEAQAIPQPQLQTEISQTLTVPQPDVQTSVTEANAIPQPTVEASVTESTPIPQPTVETSVAAAQNVQPEIQTSVAEAAVIPQPQVQASVPEVQNVRPDIQTSVPSAQSIPRPDIEAIAVDAQPSTQASIAAGEGDTEQNQPRTNNAQASVVRPGQDSPQDGGNANRSGQSTQQEGASEDNLGLAAGPDGSENPTGAPLARIPYRENRERPLNVMIDNTFGYPQAGLREASMIVEMPVEGGATRLMTVYDRIDPAQVGPVRSARDYFHTLSSNMNGILVHDGGSPSAMAAIERSTIPTFNAYSSGDLFERSGGRSAPYNLYSRGTSLRAAVNRLQLNRTRVVSGTIFRPEESDALVTQIDVKYSGIYASGFRYIADLNLYRWIRDGQPAVDYTGEAVYADAVLVARITARVIADDPEGRLYIPLERGQATLYLRGQAIKGSWSPGGGVSFNLPDGTPVDLAPFKTWVVFAPANVSVLEQE